ncbi:hypothetical protein N7520_003869 [Penicillium odoratum]|uniref:uncharacterized protein n=1 Tax=Penicillium odoratum TaxID=1167516 RepID=UPI00254676ED|nr:uncharacterized protein N7520_003869 [Penicillium odoratum]KAJ5769310.1 hypothetical protein N7520_003869 [Penicillium odoratum]
MEEDYNTIHRWLARVPDVASNRNGTGNPNSFGLDLVDGLPSLARPSTTRECIQTGISLEHGQISLQKPEPSFDRKPRHKTREDRYEYKGTSASKELSTAHKDKRKRRRSRKHTMNDVFHAPNVAPKRLTLRGSLNVGIFNKGKASSPLNPGKLPDSAFLETNFLAKRQHGSPSKSKSRNKRRKVGHDTPKKGASRQQKRPEYVFSEFLKEMEPESVNTEQLVPKQKGCDQPSDESRVDQKRSSGRSLGPDIHKEQTDAQSLRSFLVQSAEKHANDSRPATPYTWSDTSLRRPRHEIAPEIQLSDLLRVGLFPGREDDTSSNSNPENKYYSLDELKNMLDGRKEHWARTARTGSIAPMPPVIDSNYKLGTGAHKVRESSSSGDLIHPKRPQARHLDEDKTSLRQASSQASLSGPVSQTHDHDKVNSISPLERMKRPCFDLDDRQETQELQPDDIFFSNLDAAFLAIVDSETQTEMDSLGKTGIRHTSPTFGFEDIMTTAELNRAQISKESSESILLDARVGFEILYAPALDVHGHFNPKHRVTSFEEGQANYIPADNSQNELCDSIMMPRQALLYPTNTHCANLDPIPPKFWRQNRLY